MRKVIFIPADLTQPCEVKELSDDSYREIRELVGGAPDEARYDRDAVVYVHGNGAAEGLDPNERATRYAHTQSEAGQRHGYAIDTPLRALPYLLYGDAVLIGSDEQNVPQRFLEPDRLGWVLERKDGAALVEGDRLDRDLAGPREAAERLAAKHEAKTERELDADIDNALRAVRGEQVEQQQRRPPEREEGLEMGGP
jgi:hypothetical protein